MQSVKLMVLYPQPKDKVQFEGDYVLHLAMLHQALHIPKTDELPYTVTKFTAVGDEIPKYYQMFSMLFSSINALQKTLASEEMQRVANDAVRISSGGTPSILIGVDD
ncbi:Ethyl tert-butyl ether degradation EthD [Paraglaciecola sp. T6c]|uniref:EthD family reductase n=1 Tax=Pseudoalteromonas atlantica (strain T6c / ATCC BAA-1087) TaxID=3042615 RepID=UPI00005C567E|nr:EthD family reductase [Paraglaciecola sp. T6c]ABG40389.1 Ethyl tert-butyl ether degradation EthD [Paraglaciecola sp. T6c]